MTLTDVKEYLKQEIVCDCWYVGKIDAGQEHCIGIFPTTPPAPNISIGGLKNTGYRKKAVSVLIHWGKYADAAEEKAQEIFDCLFGQFPEIGGYQVAYMDFRTAGPVGINTDDKGIYEYVINFVIYYNLKGMI